MTVEKGEILELAAMPFPLADPNEAKIAHPMSEMVEISEKDYELIRNNLEWFKYDGKIRAKSATDRATIEQRKVDWRKNNTLIGLKEQIEEMKSNNIKK